MANSGKDKGWLYWLILVSFAGVIGYFFLLPEWTKIQKITMDIENEKKTIQTDLQILEDKSKIERENQTFNIYFTDVISGDHDINGKFLSTVNRLATDANINIAKSNPAEAKKHDTYNEYFANIDCSGNLEDMIEFMHLVNSSDKLLKVVKFNMSPKRGAQNEVSASMTIVKLVMSAKL